MIEAAPAPARGRGRKPKAKRLPNAILDDRRLRLADLFRLIRRTFHHDTKWAPRPDAEEARGFGIDQFYESTNNLKELGYITRKQPKSRVSGHWEYAIETLNLKVAPSSGRIGFLMLDAGLEAELAGMPWRQYTLLIYLRSHASDFVLSAKHLGERFGLSAVQIKRLVRPLATAKLVEVRTVRKARGRFGQHGYVAASWRNIKRTAIAPQYHLPETDFTVSGKIPAHNSLQETTLQLRYAEKTFNSACIMTRHRKSSTPSPEAKAPRHFLDDAVEGSASPPSVYKQRKLDKERREIDKLYERASIELPPRKPESFADAAKDVSMQLQAKVSIGAGMHDEGDGKRLVEVEFFKKVGPNDIKETLCISDRALRNGIKRATAGRVKEGLLSEQGLLTARYIIARIMQDDVPAEDAFGALLFEIEKATRAKDRWLNSWNLVARRLAGELYDCGVQRLLQQARSLAEKFKRRDLNCVLAPALFTDQGLTSLRHLITKYDADAVDEAVCEFILRSMTDREFASGHVRNWAYFVRYIKEQGEEAA